MREITTHRVTPANDRLTVVAADAPGPGGASHAYVITGFDPTRNPSEERREAQNGVLRVLFQNGTIPEVGVNGVTEQSLLAVLIDRLEGFQSGPFACHENEQTLHHLRYALEWSHRRTLNRVARGVEGKHEA